MNLPGTRMIYKSESPIGVSSPDCFNNVSLMQATDHSLWTHPKRSYPRPAVNQTSPELSLRDWGSTQVIGCSSRSVCSKATRFGENALEKGDNKSTSLEQGICIMQGW